MLIQAPTNSWWLLSGERMVSITAATASTARLAGLTGFRVDEASWANIVAAFIPQAGREAVASEAPVAAVAFGPDDAEA